MSKPKKSYDKKIFIRGIEYDRDHFKPFAFDEGELHGILDALADISAFANKNCDYDIEPLVKGSPFLTIEGLLRYQIMMVEEDLGLTLEQLETTSDFLHEREYVHNHVSSLKAVFLFDFLADIVFYSDNPALITHHPDALDKIALNLLALSFLVESQVTGSIKDNDVSFEAFAYQVWLKLGSKKISAQQFWNKAISRLGNDELEDVEISIKDQNPFGVIKTEKYLISLDKNKSGAAVIKAVNVDTGKQAGKPKSLGQINNLWLGLQNKFMKKTK